MLSPFVRHYQFFTVKKRLPIPVLLPALYRKAGRMVDPSFGMVFDAAGFVQRYRGR
jgi:hypothetical protein